MANATRSGVHLRTACNTFTLAQEPNLKARVSCEARHRIATMIRYQRHLKQQQDTTRSIGKHAKEAVTL